MGEPVAGSVANFTITLGRTWSNIRQSPGDEESDSIGAMAPQIMSVPVGATVTFRNPETNVNPHCASQFFEGLFDIGPLAPGETAEFTFETEGEFFYNDCTNPQTTGKIVVE